MDASSKGSARWSAALASALVLVCVLACAGSPRKNDGKPVCGRPGEAWSVLKESSQKTLTQACQIERKSCKKSEELPCRAGWTYATQHLKLFTWQSERPEATAQEMIEVYVRDYVGPILRTHEEVWADALEGKRDEREALKPGLAILRDEARPLAEELTRKMRDKIRQTSGPKEKALLIETYALVRRLHARTFEPFDTLEQHRADVRQLLASYEQIKVKLEFLEEDPVVASSDDPSQEPAVVARVAQIKVMAKVQGVILIDGRNTKVSTPGSVDVDPGRHTVQLLYPDGNVSEVQLIEVGSGDALQVKFPPDPIIEATAPTPTPPPNPTSPTTPIEPSPVAPTPPEVPSTQVAQEKPQLKVESDPVGLILVDSRNTGVLTPNKIEVEPGLREIQVLFEDGEASEPQTLELAPGAKVRLFFEQPKRPKDQWSLD